MHSPELSHQNFALDGDVEYKNLNVSGKLSSGAFWTHISWTTARGLTFWANHLAGLMPTEVNK